MSKNKSSAARVVLTMAALALAIGLVAGGPAIADFSLDNMSPTVITFAPPHAADDILTMAPIFGVVPLAEDVGGPGPIIDLFAGAPGFGGFELDAMSWQDWGFGVMAGDAWDIYFSVDRGATGLPGSGVFAQSALFEQAGDIYEGVTYLYAITFPPFPQPLPGGPPSRAPFGPGKNVLAPNPLLCPVAVDPEAGGDHRNLALIPTPAPAAGDPIDNVDALDCGIVDGDLYSSLTGVTGLPLPVGILPADVLASPGGPFIMYAPAAMLGLDTFGAGTDDIDALVVFDVDGAPSQLFPGVDFAVFSLRAGSATLGATGLSPGDVFITDFTGGFDIFAYGFELGLAPNDDLDGLTFGRPLPPAKCADQDGDGDVDLGDFSVFSLCFGGSGIPPAASCPPGINVDFDADGDVDLGDFSVFSLCFGGSGNPIPAGCPLGC